MLGLLSAATSAVNFCIWNNVHVMNDIHIVMALIVAKIKNALMSGHCFSIFI